MGRRRTKSPRKVGLASNTGGRPSTDFQNHSNGADVTPCPEELSEEDQQLKGELEMLVERLKVFFSLRARDCQE